MNILLELRGCMAIALLLFSNNLGAEELYKLLGFDPTAPEFDRAVYDLVETPENIVASVGLASLMLMGEIDDELSFGDSGEWSVPIGEPGTVTYACVYGGGYSLTATRTGFRTAEATLSANNCVTALGTVSGTVIMTYDDESWVSVANPKISPSLKLNFQNVRLTQNTGEVLTTTGQVHCDSAINAPLISFSFSPVIEASYNQQYGRHPELTRPEDFQESFGLPADAAGNVSLSKLRSQEHCDLVNVSVNYRGTRYVIQDVIIETTNRVFGDDFEALYRLSPGRRLNLQAIGSGGFTEFPYGSLLTPGLGTFAMSSGGGGVDTFGYSVRTTPDGFPVLDYSYYQDGFGSHNRWVFGETKVLGGTNPLRYPEWSNGEAGAELTGHYMLRGSCLLEVIGQEVFPGSRNDVVYHLELKNYPEEVAPFGPAGAYCGVKNGWSMTSDASGQELTIFRPDLDQDGTHDFFDPDDDGDGVDDSLDLFPRDESESTDFDGDGVGDNADEDDDNDGVADEIDAFPKDGSESADTDNDGVGNNADKDDDGDGVPDDRDLFPINSSEWADNDGDGIGDNGDTDDDNDGLSDAKESELGTSPLLADSDGDSIDDGEELELNLDPLEAFCPQWLCPSSRMYLWRLARLNSDNDADGLTYSEEERLGLNPGSPDSDGDGLSDGDEISVGSNPLDMDSDGDGLADGREVAIGSNPLKSDSDGDSINDADELSLSLDPLVADCPSWMCDSGLPLWFFEISKKARQSVEAEREGVN